VKNAAQPRTRLTRVLGALAAISLGLAAALAGAVAPAQADGLPFASTPTPTFYDQPFVGAYLDIAPGDWEPNPDSYTYQWFADGTPISGATDVEYRPTSNDQGKVITASITASKVGYASTTELSDPSQPVGPPRVSPGTPTITGTPDVGSTLTANANASGWSPAGTTFTYQWQRNFTLIDGATSSTYTLTKRDAGQQLTVEVTGAAPGYQDQSAYPVDWTTVNGTGYVVEGTITGLPSTGSTPVALDNILVELYEGTDPSRVEYAWTDSDGKYEIDFGPDDATANYTLEFNRSASGDAADYVHVWLGNQVQQDHATQFGMSPTSTTATEDIQLDRASTISGVVKDSSGNPIPNVSVSAAPAGQYGGQYGSTDSTGHYTLTQVSPIDTILSATGAAVFADSALDTKYYNNQWWDHSSTAAAATPLTITPGTSISNINFDLTDEATVTGRVVDAAGDGVPYMSYTPWHYNTDSHLYVSPRQGPFLTDADGYFRQPANGWTSYKFSFDDELGAGSDVTETRTPYDTVWYNNATSFAAATPVDLPGESTQVDIGNIVVTPHSGGPGFIGTPVIDDSDVVSDNLLELTGIAQTPGTATLSVQWNRDGTPIPGATDFDYLLVPADQGHQLTATLTSSLDGFTPATVTTDPYDLRQQFVNVTQPAITGTAVVGQPLSVSDGSWTPTPDSVSYQWLRTVGTAAPVAIDGATASSYTPTAGDFGDTITAAVTATAAGYADSTLTTAATAPVTSDVLITDTPTILGTPTVGQTLTAVAGTWAPGTVSFAYQWMRDGVDILGANASTYPLIGTDAGTAISVRVTGSEDGFPSASSTSAATATVASGTLTTGTPTIAGTAAVGATLTASTGTWGPGTVGFTYQWVRGSTDIADATGSTYALTAADAGATISVRVTGAETGYTTASVTSSPTAAVATGVLVPGAPSITGSPVVGQQLTAVPGTWGPGTVGFTYQWVQGSTDIPGETNATYTVAQADAAKTISVRVTGSEAGYTSASATSSPTAAVTGGALSTVVPTVSGATTFGQTLTAQPGTWGPGVVALGYQWLRDGVNIPGATTSNYALGAADIGTKLSVQVTGTEFGYTTQSVTSAQTAAVAPLDFTSAPTVSISGPSALNNYTASTTGSWAPAQDAITYQWYRDGVAIDGATGSTYQALVADVTHSLTVAATGTKVGYRPSSALSAAVIPAHAIFTTPGAATVTGSAIVGQTLTAHPGTWSPTPSSFFYYWQYGPCSSGGPALQESSSATYVIKPVDAGKTICATVTASAANYLDKTVATASTGTVSLAPLTTDTPTITGTAALGETLTAVPGAWGPGTVTFSYQWYRDSVAITGASNPTYIVTGTDVGHAIHVIVTGSESGYSTSLPISSAATVEVTPALFDGTQAIVVTGVAAVGRTLTETVTSTLAPTPSSSTIAWLRDGAAIAGATKSTYVLSGADAGHVVTASVTSTLDGYVTYSDVSNSVSPTGAFTAVPTPTISGTAKLGATLTTVPGTWAPVTSPATTFDYAWRVNGLVVQDGASKTYVATTDDVGFPITVTVTGSATGYAQASASSLPTAKVAAGVLTAATPKITGTTKVGNTLGVTEGAWSPAPDSFTYQWNRAGKAISGATASTYLLGSADNATTLTVTVTAHLRGYTTLAKASAATAKIAAGTITPPTTAMALSGAPKVGVPLTVGVSGWGPAPVTFAYQWYNRTTTATAWTAIAGATAASYTPVAALSGRYIMVEVRGAKTGYTTTAYVSSAFQLVSAGTITTGTPTITGALQVGATLTAAHAGWGPTGAVLHYQWYHVAADGTQTAITGGTAATHVVAATDVNTSLSVAITGATLTGYTSVTAAFTSAQTLKVLPGFTSKLSGTVKSGQTLTATPLLTTATNPIPVGATVTYQWFSVSGTTVAAIAGATSSTLPLTGTAYKGKTIKATITVTCAGYATVAATSAVTAKVA
jgi:protocatechuate 3,4-dioxygenase beta subunit